MVIRFLKKIFTKFAYFSKTKIRILLFFNNAISVLYKGRKFVY